MCLAIPGQVIEFVDDELRLAKVDVAGVQRNVNVSLLDGDDGGVAPGDWVLIHVGFALSRSTRRRPRRRSSCCAAWARTSRRPSRSSRRA